MKKALMLSMALMLVASSAFAQAGGTIELVEKFSGLCYINAASSGFSTISVLHNVAAATASEYSIDWSNAVGAAYLFQTVLIGLNIGTHAPGDGYSAAYGACINGPSINHAEFGLNGAWGPCSYLEVVNHAISGKLVGVDCGNAEQPAAGAKLWLGGDDVACGGCLVPVQEKTWGEIKSLYN